jgi:hypothetical protein
MVEVHDNIFVGSDLDFTKIAHRDGWSCLRCCKFGQSGHKELLGYSTQAAPEGPNKFVVVRGDRLMALNLLDLDDPNYVNKDMIKIGLAFIKYRLEQGDKVLVACNKGHSRGPSVALMFLRSIGDMPRGFIQAEKVFRTLYPEYSPKSGIRQFSRDVWDEIAPKEYTGE